MANSPCAWHSPASDNASHGICDDCMERVFGVNASSIHNEIKAEDNAQAEWDATPSAVDASAADRRSRSLFQW